MPRSNRHSAAIAGSRNRGTESYPRGSVAPPGDGSFRPTRRREFANRRGTPPHRAAGANRKRATTGRTLPGRRQTPALPNYDTRRVSVSARSARPSGSASQSPRHRTAVASDPRAVALAPRGSWGGQCPSLGDYVTGTRATRGAAAAREGAPRPQPAPLAEIRPAALAPDLGVSDSVRGTYGHPRPRPGSAFARSDTQGVRPDRSQMCRAPRPDERPSRSCPPPKT